MNNTLEKIKQIYQQMQNSPNRLSILLPQIYPIALECKDYEGFCMLFCWEKPLSQNKGGNISQYNEAEKSHNSFVPKNRNCFVPLQLH